MKLPLQVTPMPCWWYPTGQAQVNDPIVFVHVATEAQLSVSFSHSLIS